MTLFEKIKGMNKDELADYIVHTIVIAIGPENFNSEIYQSMLEAARATMDEQVEEDDVANAVGEELKENDEAGAEEASKVIDVPEGTWATGGSDTFEEITTTPTPEVEDISPEGSQDH